MSEQVHPILAPITEAGIREIAEWEQQQASIRANHTGPPCPRCKGTGIITAQDRSDYPNGCVRCHGTGKQEQSH